jgi:hypothetical protein
VTDVTMTALVVLAVLAVLRWQAAPSIGRASLTGALAGLAGSTKYNGLGACLSFFVASVQAAVPAQRPTKASTALALGAFACALAVAFFSTSPYILIDWKRFLRDVNAVESTIEIGHGMNLGRGWWYFGLVVLPAGVGWPMLLAGVAGVLLLATTRARRSLVIVVFPVAYYLFAGHGYAVFARYILPVVPFVCIAAAWFVVSTVRWVIPTSKPLARGILISTLALLLATPTARQSMQIDRLLSMKDNRLIVAAALGDTLPLGSVICQTGARYGRVPLTLDERTRSFVECDYDPATGQFSADPQWVLVQRSPLALYSAVSASLEQLLHERFTLVSAYPSEAKPAGARLYDQQDAFYLPLRNFEGIRRPGPSFDLYRRRDH